MGVFREVKVSTLHKWRVALSDVFGQVYPGRKFPESEDKLQDIIDEMCAPIGDKEMQGFGEGTY